MSDAPSDELPTRSASLARMAGLAWFAAATSALPAALRARGGGASFADAWLMATAVGCAFLLPFALLGRRAARGYRGVVGREAGNRLTAGLVLWASLSAVGLGVLGTVLHAKTHHRGLGGATYGIVGLAWLVASAVLAARLVALGEALKARGVSRSLLSFGPSLVALGAVLFATLPLLRSSGEGGVLRSFVWDLALLVAVAAAAFSRAVPSGVGRGLERLGLPLVAFTLVAGGLRVETSAAASIVAKSGGLAGGTITCLAHWSDRDGDGVAAHFGGRDCDEGDAKRYPGAPETPGDGVDSDCDGQDPPAPEHATASTAEPVTSATATASAATSAAPTPSAQPTASPDASARPDIIVVTLDTVRADRTSLHGFPKKTTPNLEKLATEGAVFDHAYAVAADTQRALMPIVSGRPLSETPHATGEWPVLDDKPDMVAERLARAGYHTGAVTSFTWLRRDRGFAQGFEVFDESAFRENHPERKVTGAKAIDAAIAAHAELSRDDKPLYLWVHLFDAHSRYLAHPGISFGKSERDLYLGEIAFVDRELGRLIDAVAKGPRAKRTTFIVHGSHGEAFGEHASTGHGTQLFDEVLHVPMLIAGAHVKPRHVETAVSVFDVAPTVAALAGADANGLTGVSLVSALAGDNLTRPPFVAHAYRRVAVFDWPLKLTGFKQKTGKLSLTLFDLAADPAEKRDLVKSRPDDAKRLDALRKQAEERGGDEPPAKR